MPESKNSQSEIVLVTGAAGFIGSGLVGYLNSCGYENLILVDDLELGPKWKNLVRKKFLDLISRETLFSFLEEKKRKIAAIFHLGACADTTEENADYLLENNYRFSKRLLVYALRHKARFIYASSAATYGLGELGFSDDEDKILDLKPLNKYAFSKQLFDLWVRRENLFSQVVGLKYFNIFGPNEAHKGKMSSVVYKMTNLIMNDGRVQLFKSNDPKYGDGEQKRDFIYVKDAVMMTAAFWLGPLASNNGIYNIGRAEAVSWNRLVKAIFNALNKPCQIEYVDMPKELLKQYQNYTCADMTKFIKAYEKYDRLKLWDIEDAVIDYVNYILKDEIW